MRAVDIIEAKRDGKTISAKDIQEFVKGVVDGTIPDYQSAAFLMAVYFKGMTTEELVAYTDVMLHSGDTLSFPGLSNQFKVDKHSTGGVGDKVSLSLAPMVAACGPVIPMISGRGLGHTGGTLDKLEAIPGFRVDLSSEEIEKAVKHAGFAITGQTASLVPADKKFYALRDVTGTVPSVELIAASIMSKKLSVGLNGLVLDVKVGTGAFMKTQKDAERLADTMIAIGNSMNCKTKACITSMDQPLGVAVGNANEVIEAIDMLKGKAPADYAQICFALGTEMLTIATSMNREEARKALEEVIRNGKALEHFRKCVEAQGGDPRVVDDYSILKIAPNKISFNAKTSGYISGFQCESVGKAGCVLGAGREKAGEPVDHSVGLEVLHKIGDKVEKDEPIFNIYYQDKSKCDAAIAILNNAYTLSDTPVEPAPLIRDVRG